MAKTLEEKIKLAEEAAERARLQTIRKIANIQALREKDEASKTGLPGESREGRTHRLVLIGAESHRIGIKNADVFLAFCKSLPNSIFDDALKDAIKEAGSLKLKPLKKDVA